MGGVANASLERDSFLVANRERERDSIGSGPQWSCFLNYAECFCKKNDAIVLVIITLPGGKNALRSTMAPPVVR